MYRIRRLLLLSCLIFGASFLVAQEVALSNLKSVLWIEGPLTLPDSLLIFPNSLVVTNLQGDTLTPKIYKLQGQKLVFNGKQNKDTLKVYFRSLDRRFSSSNSQRDSNLIREIQPGQFKSIPIAEDPFALLDFKQLNYSGSFARGLSFGNQQDLVLNSNFNLQMSGDLGDGIQIKAAITDENIPLQPEGNTQQLQEFDQVYVELSKGKNSLKAGDYELANRSSYFSRFYKKLQGLTLNHQIELGQSSLNNQASFALTRGKFAQVNIPAIEGNQGPYKLRGLQGERFIIVLSGTERIWIDGQPLQRGLEEDYIIDYNLGEVTFTNRQLIRRETRILIEYEYLDQTYARSIIAMGSEFVSKKHRVSFNLVSQQDSKNTSGFFALNDEDRAILAIAGDDPSQSIVSSVRPLDDFSPARVAYSQKDTLTPCGLTQILIFSNQEGDQLVSATFSFVGTGNGLYRLSDQNRANELVYEFIGRDSITCQPLGDYMPAVQLTPPQVQQLWTFRDEWLIDEQTSWTNEVAWSNNDQNRFSSQDQVDNRGLAFFTHLQKRFERNSSSNEWALLTDLSYEYKGQNFVAFNPYRDPEFLRDWSLADFSGVGQIEAATEHLVNGGVGLKHPEHGSANYQFKSFLRGSDYQGRKHLLQLDLNQNNWILTSKTSILNANTAQEDRRFIRPNLNLSKTFNEGKGWTTSLSFDAEDNQRSLSFGDSLQANSYAFYNYGLALSSPSERDNTFSIGYKQRTDLTPENNQLTQAFSAQELSLENQVRLGRNVRLKSSFIYRNLSLKRESLNFSGNSGNSFLGRINGNFSAAKGLLRSSLNYELGGGQEPERTFSYVRVRKGEGIYIWLDSLYNNDGIIQPNEMEISPFPDQAEYLRVSTFSDNFIQTNNINFNWSVQLSPKALLFNATSGFKKLLARFSNQSSLKINRRTQANGDAQAWDPFDLNVADSSLIAVSSGLRNVLFFNRGNPIYDIQAGWSDNRRKFVQNIGFESRINASNFLKLRLKLGAAWVANLTAQLDRQENDSQFFDNKDYKINTESIEPDFSWIPNRNFSLKFNYQFAFKKNTLETGGETSRNQELGSELSWNQNVRTNLKARFSYIRVDFSGIANSPVGFALLNGLQNGNNTLWNLSLDRQLGRNLRLQLTYEGRKTGQAAVVHVGRAQVAALF
ncbi:MAG: hypothetical protein Sapg2KO_50570 [Saprospiraceae bacterium]